MEQSFELRYYLSLLKRRFLYGLIPFVLVLAAGTAVALLLPAVYRSEAKILVESQQIPSDLVKSTVNSFAEERIEIIKQRVMTRDTLIGLAQKFNLFNNRQLPLSNSEKVDLMRDRVSITALNLDVSNRRQNQDSVALAFTIGFDYEDPQAATQVANELVTNILSENARVRTTRAQETTRFLERESERLQSELQRVETEIANYKEQNRDSLPDRIEYQMQSLERANTSLGDLSRDQKSLEDERRLLEFEFNMKAAKSSSGDKTSAPNDLAATLAALRAELTQKSAIYSETHPDIKALKQQIKSVEDQMAALPAVQDAPALTKERLAELAKTDPELGLVAQKIAAVDARSELLVQQRKGVEDLIGKLRDIIARGPEVERGLTALDRQREGIQKQLEDIGTKYSAAQLGQKLEQDQQGERFEVIEQAVFPQEPVRPNRGKILALSFVLASASSFAAIFGVEFLNKSIRSSADLANTLYHRPLVLIPYITTRREIQQRRNRIIFGAASVVTCVALGLIGLHFLYQPLDILMLKLLSRLQI
ncbi:MAG: hypothetical protein U1E46_16045 [Hyphomicrobiales bacterium]